MDLVGKRFRPLPNSKRYGPKKWVEDSEGVFCEVEMTPLDYLEHDLAGGSDFFDHTKPITEEDIQFDPALKDYLGGRAVFPKAAGFDVSTKGGAAASRKRELAWQERALAMHDAQTTIKVDDKPEDGSTTGKYFRELKRGD